MQRGKGKVAKGIIGWAVTVGERKLVKRAAVYTEKQMAKLLGKGYNILVRGGREQAERVARKIWGDGYIRHGGHILKKTGKLGEPHFQPVKQLARQHARKEVEKGWHIFYSAAPVLFLSEEVDAMAIYDDKYPGESVAHYLTVTKYVGEDSWISYLDWVNPLELIAIGGDIGRNWDRERTKELRALVFTQVGRDGSVQVYEMDPEGQLLRVFVVSPSGRAKEMTAEDFYILLAEQGEELAPLPVDDGRTHQNYAGDVDVEHRIYASKRGWQYDRKTLAFYLPQADAAHLVRVGEFWVNFDADIDYLYVLVHPHHRAELGQPGFLVDESAIPKYRAHPDKAAFLREILEFRRDLRKLFNLALSHIP